MENYSEFAVRMKNALKLQYPPVAIAFSMAPPPDVNKLDSPIRFCQMLDKVRYEGETFYTTCESHTCDGGSSSCGMKDMSERIATGEFLCKMGLFGTPRAARRFINANPRIKAGTVKFLSFAPAEKGSFEPDVIAVICNAKQGMILCEAFAYDSGKRAAGMTGPPICSSIAAAPYLTGEVIYSLGDHGARNYMNIKDDEIFVGIPAELFKMICENVEKLEA